MVAQNSVFFTKLFQFQIRVVRLLRRAGEG